MPVFALYNFDEAGSPVLDSALDNGAQNGKYINGAAPVDGQAVLDGIDDFVKIFPSDTFQMDRGTLDISFTQTAHVGTGNNTLLSRDSVGENAGGYRIEITADGAIQIVHETDGGAETFGTPEGFVNPGDAINLSYSWDANGTGGQFVVTNATTGETFDAPVPDGLTMDQGDDSQPWTIGAGQGNSDPDVLNNIGPYFQGTIETFSLSDTVDNLNGDPDANPDEAVTDEDTPVVINVLGNDTDPQGQPLTVTEAVAENGTVTIGDDGQLVYTPNENYNGPDEITYTVTDPDGNTATSTVTVTVNPVNDAPIAEDDVDTVDEYQSVTINVLGNDTDPDGDPLSISGTPTSDDGTVVVNDDGTLTFTPNPGFFGDAIINYEVTDLNGGTDSARVTVTVNDLDSGPTAQPDEAVTDEDTPVVIDVLANDGDPDNDPLTVVSAEAQNGTVVINDDGTLTYTPDADFYGEDSITYTITDPSGNSSTSDVAVVVNPVNDAPVAVDDVAETPEDTPVIIDVLGNDTDPDGDTLTITGTPTSADGEVVVNDDGTLTFTPTDGFTGETTITYDVTDGNGGTDTATVTVTVAGANDAPVAVDDVAETDEDTPVVIDVLGNDTDPDGDTLSITGTPTSEQGEVTVDDQGRLVFTPNPDFTGEATITYDITDGNGGTDTGSVTVTVNPVNDPPVTVADAATTLEDQPVLIDIVGNDSDPDGDTLSIVGVPTSEDGTVEVTDDGQIIFTPNTGFIGDATINYTITDSNGGNADGIAVVTVTRDPDNVRDGIVYGTGDGELIDGDYTGDNDGDFVDREDAIIQPDAPNDDRIYAGAGDDTILANLGDDSVRAQGGDDSVFGGVGDDSLAGGRGDDTLRGDDGADSLRGQGGDDSLVGGIGNDTLAGGDGNDTLTGNTGNDSVRGMDGDDVIDTGSSLPRPDIDFPGVPGFPGYPADTDPNDDRDTVFGGFGDDSIRTGDDADSIKAGYGDDTVDAGVDADTVYAMLGDDSIIGGEGSDLLYAGQGNDIVYGGLTPQFDGLNIPDGTDPRPNNGMDTIYGGMGNDTIFGQDDNDRIFGGQGNDLIDGGIDNDTVFGGMGNDTIRGGQGADSLIGGGDRDVFVGAGANDTIDGYENGDDFDTLDLSGSGPLRIVYADDNPENGTVTFLDADGNPTGTMNFTNIENVIPCFTPGTLIATPRGEVPVETLRAGDKIVTRDNGIQEIAWTGSKTLKWADLHANPHLQPVLVKQGSLGNGLPERDMMVSPNHRMLVANDRTALYFDEHEVLVAAKHLVGSAGVHTLDSMGTTYIHFMFAQHEVVLSNGAWTESFQPGDYTLKGMGNAQRSEILELFPDLKTVEGLADYTAARRTLKRHEARLLVR